MLERLNQIGGTLHLDYGSSGPYGRFVDEPMAIDAKSARTFTWCIDTFVHCLEMVLEEDDPDEKEAWLVTTESILKRLSREWQRALGELRGDKGGSHA